MLLSWVLMFNLFLFLSWFLFRFCWARFNPKIALVIHKDVWVCSKFPHNLFYLPVFFFSWLTGSRTRLETWRYWTWYNKKKSIIRLGLKCLCAGCLKQHWTRPRTTISVCTIHQPVLYHALILNHLDNRHYQLKIGRASLQVSVQFGTWYNVSSNCASYLADGGI